MWVYVEQSAGVATYEWQGPGAPVVTGLAEPQNISPVYTVGKCYRVDVLTEV